MPYWDACLPVLPMLPPCWRRRRRCHRATLQRVSSRRDHHHRAILWAHSATAALEAELAPQVREGRRRSSVSFVNTMCQREIVLQCAGHQLGCHSLPRARGAALAAFRERPRPLRLVDPIPDTSRAWFRASLAQPWGPPPPLTAAALLRHSQAVCLSPPTLE